MQPTRFDTRLIQILSAMAAVAVIVGIGGIGVNRYLVQRQNAVMAETLPAIAQASRIGAAADVADGLRFAVGQAGTVADLDRIGTALRDSVREIEAGTARLEGAPDAAGPDLLSPLLAEARAALDLRAAIDGEAARLTPLGLRLEELVSDQTDLARLRITAGLSDLALDPARTGRGALDALADRHFFAFERLTELGRTVDAIHLALQRLPRSDAAERAALVERLAGLQAEARARLVFLPLDAQRAEAAGLLGQLDVGAPGGTALARWQGDWLARRAGVAAQGQALRGRVDRLVARADAARDAAQARGLAQIATQQRLSGRLLGGLLGLVALAVAAAAVLWVYARRRLVRRIAAVSQRIVQVARGDHGAAVAISGADEIGRMEKALNILRRRAIEAARLRDRLEQAVIARTGEVVAEMDAANTARAEAEAADRSKTEFLARMGHELHTPLNGLIGMLTLLEGDLADPALRERARLARAAARDLAEITGDIMLYAGSAGGAGRLNPVAFDLRALVGQLAQQLDGLAAGTGLATSVDLAPGAPPVLCGDVVKIRQVVGNLMSNAVKYTPRGRVGLHVDHAPDPDHGAVVLSFAVTDTGIGMDAAMVARACDSYARADAALRGGIGGLGLGLAISRTLTEALGGALTVESRPGHGTRATLTVPLSPGDPALIPEDEAAALARPATTGGRAVLVVDDHAVNRLVARGYLERLGCRVTEAATGSAALEAARAAVFDLALVDLDLPDRPGAEVARGLAALWPAPRLAALTAFPVPDTAAERAALSVDRILHKPVSPRDLAELLDGLGDAAGQGRGAHGQTTGYGAGDGAEKGTSDGRGDGARDGAESGTGDRAESGAGDGAGGGTRDGAGGPARGAEDTDSPDAPCRAAEARVADRRPDAPGGLAPARPDTPAPAPRDDTSAAPRDDPAAALAEDIADLGAEAVAGIVAALLADLDAAPGALAEAGASADPRAAQRRVAHRLRGAAANLRLDALGAALARAEAQEGVWSEADRAALATAASDAARRLRAAARQAGLEGAGLEAVEADEIKPYGAGLTGPG